MTHFTSHPAQRRRCDLRRIAVPLIAALAVFVTFPALTQGTLKPRWITDPDTGCGFQHETAYENETVRWSGACRNGAFYGPGVLQRFLDGKLYCRVEGDFQHGTISGPGSMTYIDVGRYDGELLAGAFSGQGKFTYVKGDSYEGQWRNSRPNGHGKAIHGPDHTVFEGAWRNGCFSDGGRHLAFMASNAECGFTKLD